MKTSVRFKDEMKRYSKIILAASILIVGLAVLVGLDLVRTYRGARAIAADKTNGIGKFDDCVYVGTHLSYEQICDPPVFFRLPHWQVTYNSTNPAHGGTQFIGMSQARRRKRTTN